MHGKIVKYEIHLEQKMITIRVHTVSEGIAGAHHITDIPATVFPWQRTPATRDALHVVMLESLQSISRDSFP